MCIRDRNETSIANGLEVVRRLSPQTYDKVIAEDFVEELTDDVQSSKEAGLIAQEVHRVIPHAVVPGDDTKLWTVDYNHVLAYALAGLRELDAIVQEQAVRIAALERGGTAKKTRTSKVT